MSSATGGQICEEVVSRPWRRVSGAGFDDDSSSRGYNGASCSPVVFVAREKGAQPLHSSAVVSTPPMPTLCLSRRARLNAFSTGREKAWK